MQSHWQSSPDHSHIWVLDLLLLACTPRPDLDSLLDRRSCRYIYKSVCFTISHTESSYKKGASSSGRYGRESRPAVGNPEPARLTGHP